MKVLLIALAFALVATSSALAQDIGPVRPDVTLQSPTSMQALGTFVFDGTWDNCLLIDGDDHLVAANRFECKPITDAVGITIDHLVIVTSTGGNVVVRGVTVNAAGIPSEPSANTKTVLSIPFGPSLLSDSTEAQEAQGTEDLV
jgi:hypothetical protein